MIALELVLYGVRHFLNIKKLAFGPGFNLVHGGNGSGKTTVAETFFEMLALDKNGPDQSLAPAGGKDLCQAALIFESQDGGVYRLVRDFLKGNGSLSKLDPEKKFNLLSKDNTQIEGFIHSEIQKLSADRLRDGLFLSRAAMPSSRLRHRTSRSMPLSGNNPKTPDRSSSQSKLKRLEEIQASLASADQIIKFEEQLDKVQNRLSDIKRQLQRYEDYSRELKQLQQQQADYQGFQDLPKNISTLLDDYKTAEKTHAQEVRELDEQKLYVEDQLAFIPSTPIFLSKFFLLGIGIMVVSLLLALFLQLEGLWQTLYLLGLLTGAVLVVVSVLLDVRRLTRKKSIEGKLVNLTQEQETLETKFKKQNAAVFDLLKKTSCQNVDQLKDKTHNFMETVRAGRNLKDEQDRLLGGKSLVDLDRERQALVVSAKELESKIKGAQGSSTDVYILQEEMRMIQREIAEQQTSKPKETGKPDPVPDPMTGSMTGSMTAEKENSSTAWSPLFNLFESVPKKQLESHAAEWLRRLTRGRCNRLEYDGRSNLTVIDTNGSPVPFDRLSSGVQDQVYLSILWAGWQLTSSGISALPVVLDDPLAGLDEPGHQAAIEILKELGQHRQIILLTTALPPNRDNLQPIKLD